MSTRFQRFFKIFSGQICKHFIDFLKFFSDFPRFSVRSVGYFLSDWPLVEQSWTFCMVLVQIIMQ